jgi:N-carbamoyl-L-amino-acid hydrolase
MDMRKDALFAANNLISKARHELGRLDSNLVYTMGRMNVLPNIHTVIPNKVIFSLEARHTDEDVIASVEKIIQSLPDQAELLEGCEVRVTKLWGRDTVWFDKTVCDEVEESVRSLGYSYKRMVSGAGHDAQFLASYIPTAMIFIPSVNGKSHCEEEFTPWEECEKGVNVLLETVIKLAQK